VAQGGTGQTQSEVYITAGHSCFPSGVRLPTMPRGRSTVPTTGMQTELRLQLWPRSEPRRYRKSAPKSRGRAAQPSSTALVSIDLSLRESAEWQTRGLRIHSKPVNLVHSVNYRTDFQHFFHESLSRSRTTFPPLVQKSQSSTKSRTPSCAPKPKLRRSRASRPHIARCERFRFGRGLSGVDANSRSDKGLRRVKGVELVPTQELAPSPKGTSCALKSARGSWIRRCADRQGTTGRPADVNRGHLARPNHQERDGPCPRTRTYRSGSGQAVPDIGSSGRPWHSPTRSRSWAC